jgi:hypothetical protein
MSPAIATNNKHTDRDVKFLYMALLTVEQGLMQH